MIRRLSGLALATLLGCNLFVDNKGEVIPSDPTAPPATPVRVLVAYTYDVWDDLLDQGIEPLSHAAYRIELANLVFSNSGVTHVVELAGATRLVSQTTILVDPVCALEDGRKCGSRWLADALAAGNYPVRESAEADVVLLMMTDEDDVDFGGYARGTPSDHAPYQRASATIMADDALGFVHELGHLFGAHHDRYQREEPEEIGINYGDTFTAVRARSLMAYGGECESVLGDSGLCPQIAWFTNPSVFIDGVGFGSASEEFNACRAQHFGPSVGNYFEIRDGQMTYTAPALITSCLYELPNNYDIGGALCPGDYEIARNEDFELVEGCASIEGDLEITGAEVESLAPLAGLVQIGGDLILSETATNLTDLTGLESLRSVEDLKILSPIDSLVPLTNLAVVDVLEIRNATLLDLNGLQSLASLNTLLIRDCPSLITLQGFPARVTALDALRVIGNDALETLEHAAHLKNLGTLEVRDNDALVKLTDNPFGLESLLRLEISGNADLETLRGVDGLLEIPDGIVLESGPIADLSPLVTVVATEELVLHDLDWIGDLWGLRRLNVVQGEVRITDNDNLRETEGMEVLATAALIDVSGNPLLTTCEFPALQAGVLLYCDIGQP